MLGNKSLPSGKPRGKQLIAPGVFFIEEQVRWFKNKINPINGLMYRFAIGVDSRNGFVFIFLALRDVREKPPKEHASSINEQLGLE